MAATLNIKVSKTTGVEVFGDTEGISDLREVSDLVRAASLGVSIINQSLVELNEGTLPPMEEPKIFLPAFVDGLQDSPRELRICVNNGPRDSFCEPPTWFINAMKKSHPDFFMDVESDLEAETAVMMFQHSWLDHWGWCGLYDSRDEFIEDLLVSEPYRLSSEDIKDVSAVCEENGWEYKLVGRSAHYPSATLRIEIRPAKAAA